MRLKTIAAFATLGAAVVTTAAPIVDGVIVNETLVAKRLFETAQFFDRESHANILKSFIVADSIPEPRAEVFEQLVTILQWPYNLVLSPGNCDIKKADAVPDGSHWAVTFEEVFNGCEEKIPTNITPAIDGGLWEVQLASLVFHFLGEKYASGITFHDLLGLNLGEMFKSALKDAGTFHID